MLENSFDIINKNFQQQRHDLVEKLKDFLLGVCENLNDSEEIQKVI